MPQAGVDHLDFGPIQFLRGLRAYMKRGPGDVALANFDGKCLALF